MVFKVLIHSMLAAVLRSNVSSQCSSLPSRAFQYTDPDCGDQQYYIKDLMPAFTTDHAYWEQEGGKNPWWAVDITFAHGDIPDASKLSFYDKGREEVQTMAARLEPYHVLDPSWRNGKKALDFGCGLGRMSNGLISLGFSSVTCVDMTKSFLDAAEADLGRLAGRGSISADVLSKITFVQSDLSLVCHVPPGSIDFVHSVITLQHNKPKVQAVYLEQLCDVLAPGGRGFIGIPVTIFKQKTEVHCDIGHEQANHMNMHYTREEEVVRHLALRGCEVIAKLPMSDIHVGISEAFVFRKK